MKIGYALSGGGGKGGFSAGVAYELWKKGITPDVVSGISVGALNGILIALGQYGQMRKIWHEVTDSDVRDEPGAVRYGFRFALHKIGITKPQIGYWKSSPLKKLVRKHIINKSLKCDYYCGAVEVESNTFENFYLQKDTIIHEGNVDGIVDKIVASTAIPAIFEPVHINGKMYVDGGVHYQMPLKPISKLIDQVDYIIGVAHSGERFEGSKVTDDLDMLQWLIPSLLDQTAERDFERFELINEMCRAGVTEWKGKKRKYYDNTIFRPTQELSPSTRFHHRFGKKDFEHGMEIAKSFNHEKIHS